MSANGLLRHPCVVYSAKGSVCENENETLTCPSDVASAAATPEARSVEGEKLREKAYVGSSVVAVPMVTPASCCR